MHFPWKRRPKPEAREATQQATFIAEKMAKAVTAWQDAKRRREDYESLVRYNETQLAAHRLSAEEARQAEQAALAAIESLTGGLKP